MATNKFKICLTGGGTGGSVTPLLALADYLIATEKTTLADLVWLGSKNGLEKNLIIDKGITYKGISSGKLRRYFSVQNFTDPFYIFYGFIESLIFFYKNRPNIIISAGSFVAVPVIIAGWFFRIPCLVHQMDVRPGLANKIMAPFAKIITVTFAKSLNDYGNRAVLVGNTVRPEIKKALEYDPQTIKTELKITDNKPLLLIVGGGTGASAINNLTTQSQSELEKTFRIVHQTGAGKEQVVNSENYQSFEFLSATSLAKFYSLATVVVSRAGLGFVSELAYLSKPSIIIPMPDSHQEDNAKLLSENGAAIVLDQKKLSSDVLVKTLNDLLSNKSRQEQLGQNINKLIKTDAEIEVSTIIAKYL